MQASFYHFMKESTERARGKMSFLKSNIWASFSCGTPWWQSADGLNKFMNFMFHKFKKYMQSYVGKVIQLGYITVQPNRNL